MNAAQAVRALVRGALDPDGPGTVHDLVRIVAQVSGSRGALLWEVPDERSGAAGLSVLALWVDPADGPVPPELDADPVTALAFTTRSLAVPDDVPGRRSTVLGCDVVGALPIDYVDGCRGALTLLGHRPLSGAAFDTVAELVEVLPELCGTVRERQTLALVNACETILHDGDVESRDGPVPRQQLAALLSEVCRAIAATLHAAEVSVFLEDPACPPGRYALFAHSTGAPDLDARREPVTVEPADRTGFVAGAAVPFMEVRLLGGAHVRGFVRCLGTAGPPDHFTTSDLALLRPVTAALSRYWRTWQHRCALSEENESWRRLAAGMTSLNTLVAEVLGSSSPDAEKVRRVGDLAVQIMRDVVPQTATATAYRAHPHRSRPFVAMAHTGNGAAPVPSRLAEETVRTHRQHRLGPDGDDPGWVVCTPIGIGEHVFGVLETAGPAALPPNSAQVNAIIGDQLGLYRHLQDALGRLHEARHHLELALRTEAEAMEDLKHQLVSPLRTAVSRTESVLRGGRFDGRVEAQLRAVRGLCRRASRVAMSAGVFATLSRGQQPVSKPERIGGDDLVRLLIAAADDAQVLSDPRRGITFEVDRESVRRIGRRLVHVDTSFLQQCVGNVLDNAAKYGYENTRVQVDADVAPALLTLAVASTGIPLRPTELPHVVARNWRGDMARSTTGEGSGLGLWIVDHLTRAMGGRLVVDARADLTTVRLMLPLA